MKKRHGEGEMIGKRDRKGKERKRETGKTIGVTRGKRRRNWGMESSKWGKEARKEGARREGRKNEEWEGRRKGGRWRKRG